MQVFSLLGEYHYEGFSLLGVYATEADARAAATHVRGYDEIWIGSSLLGQSFDECQDLTHVR